MLGNELNVEFCIQPGRALLLLEAEGLLSNHPSESSPLRRHMGISEWPLIWDTRKIDGISQKIIFIARKTSRFDSHDQVESLLNQGHIVIAQEDAFRDFAEQQNGHNSTWFSETIQHPQLLLCTSSDKARDFLLKNICSLKNNEWTTLSITGTNGKTSTTQIAASLLEELSHKPVLRLGTLGIRVGQHLWDNPFPTMPDYPGLLAAIRAADNDFNCRQLVMEATSIGLDENRLGDWPVNCAAFLNLTQDHLDYHGSMEKYFEAKTKLFKNHLSAQGQVVINCSDSLWKKALDAARGRNRFCIGFGDPSHRDDFFQTARLLFSGIQYLEISHKRSSTSGIAGQWTLWGDSTQHLAEVQYNVRLLGEVQHENLSAAAAMMISLGYPLKQIAGATQAIKSIAGRLEPVETGASGDLPCVLVDYAHSPDALEKTLNTCRKLLDSGGKLICVFGCGGDRDSSKRPKMGHIAAQLSDLVWVTSDNPRTESPERILKDIVDGIPAERRKFVHTEVDRRQAIQAAIRAAGHKDVILIAGKGHEDYQIIGTTKYPFSDAEVAHLALKSKIM